MNLPSNSDLWQPYKNNGKKATQVARLLKEFSGESYTVDHLVVEQVEQVK